MEVTSQFGEKMPPIVPPPRPPQGRRFRDKALGLIAPLFKIALLVAVVYLVFFNVRVQRLLMDVWKSVANPLTVVWILAILTTILLRIVLPRDFKYKNQPVDLRKLILAPVFLALMFTAIYLIVSFFRWIFGIHGSMWKIVLGILFFGFLSWLIWFLSKSYPGRVSSIWRFLRLPILIALTVGLAFTVIFSVYSYFFPSEREDADFHDAQALYGDAPAEVALPIIADAETGGCEEGKAHQFLSDGVTPVRNPPNAKPGTGSVGKWQINLDSSAVRKEIALLEEELRENGAIDPDEKLDVEKSETDNRLVAEYLYRKYRSKPWLASKKCWGPKLAQLGYGKVPFADLVNAPTDTWSRAVYNPLAENTKLSEKKKLIWGRIDMSKGGACEVMMDRDPRLVFPINTHTSVGPKVLQFRCLESGAKIKVQVVPKT